MHNPFELYIAGSDARHHKQPATDRANIAFGLTGVSKTQRNTVRALYRALKKSRDALYAACRDQEDPEGKNQEILLEADAAIARAERQYNELLK